MYLKKVTMWIKGGKEMCNNVWDVNKNKVERMASKADNA